MTAAWAAAAMLDTLRAESPVTWTTSTPAGR